MKVEAIRLGYYDLVRRRPGDVFHMKDSDYEIKKDGLSVTCSWVIPVGESVKTKGKKAKAEPESESDQDVI